MTFGAVVRVACAQEALDALVGAVEDHVDVVVARRPGVAQQPRAFALEDASPPRRAASPAPRAERRAPLLVPARAAAGVAAAVAAPALDAVGAAPGGVLDDLHFVRRADAARRNSP